MIIRKYGIELRRVTHADIELIRRMRNRYDIRRHMFYQQNITPTQQELWFQSINNANNFYFVIHDQGVPVGLINSKNIDWEKREEEAGLFMWAKQGSGIAPKAVIIMMQLGFDIIGMQRSVTRVRADNPAARQFNHALGFTPLTGTSFWELSRATYRARKARFLYIANAGKPAPPLSLEDIDLNNPNFIASAFPADATQQRLKTAMPICNAYAANCLK